MRIYLDHNATTPVRDEVIDAMLRVLRGGFGNPSSVHEEGSLARRAVELARERVAALLAARPDEIVFTASATEANNAALHGLLAAPQAPRRLVATAVEHPSVEEPLAALEAAGLQVTRLPVDAEGRVDPARAAAALERGAAALAVILANNETGVIQDMEALRALADARGIPLHVDATQAVGKIPVDVARLGAATLAASAHKLGGPKGAGALFQRRGRSLPPLVRGGPQERRRRGGTENLPGIVGFGVACDLAARELDSRIASWGALRDRLWEGICSKVPRVRRNGSAEHVLPNTLNVEFEDAAGDVLLEALDLDGVAVSTGAACASGSLEPSRVLLAMGRTPTQARGSLRFSVGHGVSEAQIDRVVTLLPELVARVRSAAA